MNNQLKLLLYIVFVVVIFYFIQDRFSIFDISFINDIAQKDEDIQIDDESTLGEEIVSDQPFVEIFRQSGNEVRLNVEVADTSAKRAAGLSNRRYLGDYDGMFFVFDEKVSTAFWMKDMYISLDIIFIDEKGFIVDIKHNNEPCSATYCPQISSSMMYKYVLEVKAGFCENNEIVIGDSLAIHL